MDISLNTVYNINQSERCLAKDAATLFRIAALFADTRDQIFLFLYINVRRIKV